MTNDCPQLGLQNERFLKFNAKPLGFSILSPRSGSGKEYDGHTYTLSGLQHRRPCCATLGEPIDGGILLRASPDVPPRDPKRCRVVERLGRRSLRGEGESLFRTGSARICHLESEFSGKYFGIPPSYLAILEVLPRDFFVAVLLHCSHHLSFANLWFLSTTVSCWGILLARWSVGANLRPLNIVDG